ncbi:MAG: hypothetical protein K0S55_1190 [Clostridia bacterium]|jgi:predicted phosphohydrolase|nr:hypothetical protein [Clostridia bacterium]
MALYAMGDLHLSTSTNKPMNIFGDHWENHDIQIKNNWCLNDDDTIVIPGDISWAMNFKELESDLKFLNDLKGKKIILKGNHDYWWTTMKKMIDFIEPFGTISFLHNNTYEVEGYSLCGTRGWIQEPGEKSDLIVLKREAGRLEKSLSSAKNEIIAFLHYPPVYGNVYCSEIMAILKKYDVKRCYYGHLHGRAFENARTGIIEGIEFSLVSSDFLKFKPLKIN